jgi:DNA-binding MarR family transcriptional regulator
MNETTPVNADPNFLYQTHRLQELMGEMVHCCQERLLLQAKRFNLPQAELKCLTLFGQERYLTVKGLAQKLEVAKSRVTILLEGLVHKGLLTRAQDPHDARVRLFSLTPPGRQKLAEVQDFLLDIHTSLLANINPEQRGDVLLALEALRASMEVVKEKCTQGMEPPGADKQSRPRVKGGQKRGG